ncbi:hypothetical protein G7072_05790 [Nocardioides sp. HDW12B]|uniref:hypothetical protein n=1 Tax=Nocardioides sp. HDW12B TaxID=2714939 RepID=UPI00140ABBAC|nr:hypothetical protein [Nocardioides sp. HDW12B]QIK65913.1 hypothetical protein G7072_05790 [Nocardioides sp. HDW12B]
MTGSSLSTVEVLVLASAALHAGFQVTVSVLVYPALLRAEPFGPAHARHSRGIAPIVVVVYGALVATGTARLVAGDLDAASLVALGGAALAGLTTALVAAPTHGRLAHGRTDALARRLTRADLVRTAGAVLGLAGALVAVLG